MGEHKHNPTATAAKKGELPPKKKPMGTERSKNTPWWRRTWIRRKRKMAKRYIAAFGLLAMVLALLAAALLVYGRVYETAIGCVCCGVLLAVAAVCGWAAVEFWREERRKK